MEKTSKDLTIRVSRISILINLILTAGKLLAGIFGHSSAMVADAVHSASDVLGSAVVIAGAVVSEKEADDKHPYGHERLECIASFIISVLLAGTGVGIGWNAWERIMEGNQGIPAVPGRMALIAAVVSVAVKEALFWYTKFVADKLNSVSLQAEAWHHRSDAFSSVGSFMGIFGARLGFPVLDPVAGVVICLFIFKVAWDVLKETFEKLIDTACDNETRRKIICVAEQTEGVLCVDDLKTRLFGSKVYVDIEIAVDENMKVADAHEIAENVHNSIEQEILNVKHCMVHVNPMKNAVDKNEGFLI